MVTKKQTTPGKGPTPAQRHPSTGAWLCNAVDNCDHPATAQASVDCHACTDVIEETRGSIDRKRDQLEHQEQAERAILDAARSEDRDLADIERLALATGAQQRQQLGSEIEKLTAALAAVVEDHTHPLYACDKHASRLPH